MILTINPSVGLIYRPADIDKVATIIEWQCANCKRRKIVKIGIDLPPCSKLTDDGFICKRQLIDY